MNDATWVKLHDLSPEDMIAADMDGNGQEDVIIDFGAGGRQLKWAALACRSRSPSGRPRPAVAVS